MTSATPEEESAGKDPASDLGPAARLPSQLDALPLAAFTVDAQGRVVSCNRAFAAATGRTVEQVVGKNVFDEFAAEDEKRRARDLFQTVLRDGVEVSNYETSVVAADGARKAFVWSGSPLRRIDGAIAGSLCVGVDVSDHERRRDATLRDDKVESLGKLAGGTARAFDDFLLALGARLDALELSSSNGASTADDLRAMRETLAHAKAFTEQLADYARFRPKTLEPIAVAEVVTRTEQVLRSALRDAKSLEIEAHGTPPIIADFGRVQQALVNLVLNALEASPPGASVRVETSTRTLTIPESTKFVDAYPGRFAVLSVSDAGAKVVRDAESRLFEPFSTKTEGRGANLGLAGAYAIVRRCGGFILVADREPTGAIFEAYFPAPTGEARA